MHNPANRRIRTRMSGGVGGEEPRGSPLSRFCPRRSRKPREFAFRIQMPRPPAEIAPRLRAAELLVERIAARPFAELAGNRVGRDDFRFGMPGAEPTGKS